MEPGDFLLVDFVGRIKATGEIFDLTVESVAREEGIYNEKASYKPLPVVLGKNMIIKGVEKELMKMKVGEEREIDVKPEDAFGKRERKLVKVISMSNFLKENISPVPGIFVDIDGKQAKVLSVSGGRVTVDFNNPLAGRELRYWVKIAKKVTDAKEKVENLLEYYKMEHEGVTFENGEVKIALNKEVDEGAKNFIATSLKNLLDEVKNVEFIKIQEKNVKEKGVGKDG